MLELYKPRPEDLWFRQKFLSDPETMSYNNAWGGAVGFPEGEWQDWYDHWITNAGDKRFYRYLMNEESEFVGETAYHYDSERKIYMADIIVYAPYRGRGCGYRSLELLCNKARENGVEVIYDDIAIDNPAISLFMKQGFTEQYRTDEIIMLSKRLRE